jgi:RND family efflux transporter MFP subunit
MKRLPMNGRTLALIGLLVPMLALFIYVVLRSGPLAPVPVVVARVESQGITPELFGVGTVEARYINKIGPTIAGRVKSVNVQVGDNVHAGQLLGEMDPVDLDEKIAALEASMKRAEAIALSAEAQVQEATARDTYAEAQATRYEQLWQTRTVSETTVEAKRQDHQIAKAALAAARANLDAARLEQTRVVADRNGLVQQRSNLRLVAPVDGLVVARDADPGTTLVAGQAVITVIEPRSIWINVRFDQLRSSGLRANLPARIALHSQAGYVIAGHVLRVEPLADAVTEEILVKVVFDAIPEALPPIGELAEVTVALPALPPTPVVPEASIQRIDGRLGVWMIDDGALRFAPIDLGVSDLDGHAQILSGLKEGERVVVYSQSALGTHSRIDIVERLPGVTP